MATIQNLTYSIGQVAEHFKVTTVDVQRWAALGFINVDTVDEKQCVSHGSLVAAIPKLSGVPMGLKRDRSWFGMAAIPTGKRRLIGDLKAASEPQLLTGGEVAARANERTNSLGITLQFSNEIKSVIDAPWLTGFQSKVRNSVGKKGGYWRPATVREAYVSEYFVRNLEPKTARSLANLYASKSEFETFVKSATDDLLNDSIQFVDSVPVPGRFGNAPTLIYSIPNNVLFNKASITYIASQIF